MEQSFCRVRGARSSGAQQGHQLIKKKRNPMVDLRFTGGRNRPRRYFRSTAPDDFLPVERDEEFELTSPGAPPAGAGGGLCE